MAAFGSASAFPSLMPGDLRHWVTFLQQSSSLGQSGMEVSWIPCTPPLGAWAKIEAIRGTDLIRAGQDVTALFITCSIWYNPLVQANMHLVSPSGAEYVILSIENVLLLNHILTINAQAIGVQANLGG